MKRPEIFVAYAFILATLMFTSPVYAPAMSETMRFFQVTETFDAFLPCAGEGTITITYNGVVHTNIDARGGFHFTLTQTGDFTAMVGGVTYTGHFALWPGTNANSGGTFVATVTFAGHGTGTDGSTIRWAAVMHITMSPDGTITSHVEEFRCL